MRTGARKHLDFEVNLIPFIDLLSTCICFLLLTAVWISVGSMNVKQAVGGVAAETTDKKPTVWVTMRDTGEIDLEARDSNLPANLARLAFAPVEGHPDLKGLATAVEQMKVAEPKLVTALLQPTGNSVYEDIIDVMDQFKRSGMTDLGVSPL